MKKPRDNARIDIMLLSEIKEKYKRALQILQIDMSKDLKQHIENVIKQTEKQLNIN